MIRVTLNPELLRWARERAGLSLDDLAKKFGRLHEWETGEALPTLKQVEAFARAVHVPVGYLFLSDRPEEAIPIPDYRTVGGRPIARPSPDLLEMIYACQDRQNWYREYARASGQPELGFVGSATTDEPPAAVATRMRDILDFQVEDQMRCSTWTDAQRRFIHSADRAGILVMVSGIVMSNTHRRLDTDEFRGFALSDALAPLVFINGSDTKAAQIFTLAHELAHLWLGESALSDIGPRPPHGARSEERWSNAVAAEFLVPLGVLRGELKPGEPVENAMQRLARTFKVSQLVVLRRLLDAGWIDRDIFDEHWARQMELLRTRQQSSAGGNFYTTTLARVGHRFARDLIVSALEGQTLYRDAFRMLGIAKMETFKELGRHAEVLD